MKRFLVALGCWIVNGFDRWSSGDWFCEDNRLPIPDWPWRDGK